MTDPQPGDAPERTVDTIVALVRELTDDAKNEPDAQRFLDLVLLMRDVKRAVNDMAADVERMALDALEGIKDADIGPHHVEVRWGKKRRWTDNDALASAVGRIVRFDPDTGEERTATEAWDIVREAFRCGGAEARTTWLKKHDIDPDEYSEGDWRGTVTIRPNGTFEENNHE